MSETAASHIEEVSVSIPERSITPRGFLHPRYAASFAEWGHPVQLTESGAWVLERGIPGSDRLDALGLYPLMCCRNWAALERDLTAVGRRWVSLSAVADPLADIDESGLRRWFCDHLVEFKTHWIVDLSLDPERSIHPNHRRKARRASERVQVEEGGDDGAWIDDMERLYAVLARRKGLRGLRAFPRHAIAGQMTVPGASVWRARADGETVSMVLWYIDGGRVWNHLGASNERGYELGASFALFRAAIDAFRDRGLQHMHLGAGPDSNGEGLGRFKRGWASGKRTSWLGGRIFDQLAYQQLTAQAGVGPADYFPAYRRAEASAW